MINQIPMSTQSFYGMHQNLTTVDVNQYRGLVELHLDDNRLMTLDVSQLLHLTHLYLGSNQLTTLDLSQNRRLTRLSVTNNQLTTIDVSQNDELLYADLDNNQLRTFEVSQNGKLTGLYLNNNQLRELPNSILSLPRNCRVTANKNPFSQEYIAAFQERLRQQQAEDPTRRPQVYMSRIPTLREVCGHWLISNEVPYTNPNK